MLSSVSHFSQKGKSYPILQIYSILVWRKESEQNAEEHQLNSIRVEIEESLFVEKSRKGNGIWETEWKRKEMRLDRNPRIHSQPTLPILLLQYPQRSNWEDSKESGSRQRIEDGLLLLEKGYAKYTPLHHHMSSPLHYHQRYLRGRVITKIWIFPPY